MKRHLLVLSLVTLSFLVACSRPDQTAGTSGAGGSAEPVTGDWVIVRWESEPDTYNPITSSSTIAGYAQIGANNSQVYELLLAYNTKDWSLTEPLLAEAYPEISDDRLSYTFKIRDGVRWHDGKPLTPEDVLFTFKAAMCRLVDSAHLRTYFTDLADVQLLEDRKVRFVMSKPSVFNVDNLANILPIVPRHVYDPDGLLDSFSFKDIIGPKGSTDPKIKQFSEAFNTHPANRAPIGTGPYKFEKWETGREVVLVRNDDYWGKKAYLDKLVFRVITDYPAALTALKAGELDLNPRLSPVQYAQQTSGGGFEQQFEKKRYTIPAYYYIAWNSERPFFKDKRVRQAMTMLVDREQIIEKVRFGLGQIGMSHFNPSSKEFNSSLKQWPYDPKRAAALLDEAGWKDTDGDGIRDKDGVPFKFEFLASVGSTIAAQLMVILKEEFRKVGIQMTERTIDFNVMTDSLKDHRFDASTAGWTSGLITDPYQIWHSSSSKNRGSNYVSFANAEADRLIEQARLEFDDEKRKQLYWRLQEIIHEEQPYTFLFYGQEAAAYTKRFQNVGFVPVRPGYDLNSWFVPKMSQKYTATAAP